MKRLDVALTEFGFAPSRSKAREMIERGEVEVRRNGDEWSVANQPSLNVETLKSTDIRIQETAQTLKYVSRGGLKLESALQHLKLDVQDLRCLDIGLSTGGFTDCLLAHGASEILGIDVGHGQLHAKLKSDPRLISMEGINVRDITRASTVLDWLRQTSAGRLLCVVDLSFISLQLALPEISGILPVGARLLALVKPQFEAGRESLNRRGVVEDPAVQSQVKERVLQAADKCGFTVEDYFACGVRGQDGNQEFFLFAHRR